MLSAFVVAQLVFDVAVVAFALVYLLMKKPQPTPEPPEWYAHFLKLAQELMTATEPVLERLESRGGGAAWARGGSAAPNSDYEAALRRLDHMGGSGRPPSPPTLRAGSESRPSASVSWSTPNDDKYEKARALLRSGAHPDEVAEHAGLQPGEMRLLTKIVAAETRPRSR